MGGLQEGVVGSFRNLVPWEKALLCMESVGRI